METGPSSSIHILVIEDELADQILLRKELELLGYHVSTTQSLEEAKTIFYRDLPHIIILHLGHDPLLSLEACRQIRAASTVPILMLTHRAEIVTESDCLSAGADDYITKPIDFRILTSRLKQQVTRIPSMSTATSGTLEWKNLRIDVAQHLFEVSGQPVQLSSSEFNFMSMLMSSPNQVFTRGQILQALGNHEGEGSDHIVNAHVSRIRAKVRAVGGPEVICVVRSVGFKLAGE